MRADGDPPSVLRSLASGALGIGLGFGVLVAGFSVSELTLSTSGVTASATRSASPAIARAAATITPTPTPTPTPRPTPTPTPEPLVVTAYDGQGLRLAALAIPIGYTVRSPIAGTVRIVLYQFLEGEIRAEANVPSEPTYPYLFVRSADREIKLRPGSIDRDVQLLVRDGDTVDAGAPLFRTIGAGPSSWHLFYDPGVTAQVIVSVIELPSGNGVDPVPVFKP